MRPVTTTYHMGGDIPRKLTLLFVCDLHGCDNGPILSAAESIVPDGILVGGDFIHDGKNYKNGLEFLTLASRLCPTFCVLGNHEARYKGDIRREVTKRGAVLLDNSSAELHGVHIGGLTSVEFNPGADPDTKWLEAFSRLRGYKLLLCHKPEYYEKHIQPLPIHLTLAGHAHGGQWRFFGRGVYAPGQGLFPKYTAGLYHGRLLVSRGLGNPHKIPRIHNPPELVVVNLRPEKD